jgi:ribonuclease D
MSEGAKESVMAEAIDSLSACSRLAFDTESDAFFRYDERVCLMQFSDDDRDYLYDPLEWGMPDEWRALLESRDRTIILHGGDFDVLSLRRDFDLKMGRLFDTLVAARCLGLTAFGLSSLLKSELDVSISKSEQRSDWGRRPLTDKQIAYARQDTVHLFRLVDQLTAKLVDMDRMQWVEEDCEILRHREPAQRVFDEEGWRKIKGSKTLGDTGRKIIRAVFVWREAEAKKLNRSPFRVIGSDGILAIAQAAEKNGSKIVGQLHKIRGVSSRLNQRGLREAIEQGLSGEPVLAVRPRRESAEGQKSRRPKDSEVKQRLVRLKEARNAVAKPLGLETSFLVSGTILERIAREPPSEARTMLDNSGLTKWRSELLRSDLWSAL